MAFAIRKSFIKNLPEEFKPGPLHLSIDSTPHEQTGEKIEGIALNYEGKKCLDSQRISDQKGLTYGFQLRAGNTGKGVGAADLIKQAFKLTKFDEEKYLSGDSAYLNQEVIKNCLLLGIKFSITAPDTINWREKLKEKEIQGSVDWERSKKSLNTEYTSILWEPSWDKNKNLRFPIVIKREWKTHKDSVRKNETGNLFDYSSESESGFWKYYAVATNTNVFEKGREFVILHHNKRGNCERFIREEKYGFDLLHFPCLKMSKNYSYGCIVL